MKYSSAWVNQRADRKGTPWVGYLRFKEGGKWRQVTKTFPTDTVRTKRQAQKALEGWRQEMERNAELPCSTTTVEEYAKAYLETVTSKRVDKRTLDTYKLMLPRMNAAIGDIQIGKLTTAQVQAWTDDLEASGLMPRTVKRYLRLISMICKYAVSVRDIPWNPCDAVVVTTPLPPVPNPLDVIGYAKLLATLDEMEADGWQAATYIAACTGMREGEVCGLKWSDLDEDEDTISVTRSISRDHDTTLREKGPKTKAGNREIPLMPRLKEELNRRREAMRAALDEAGVEVDDEKFGQLYICGSIDGSCMNPRTLGRRWKRFAIARGINGTAGSQLKFHDLRDTFASVMVAAGVDVKTVAGMLGHSTPAVTLTHYAGMLPSASRAATKTVAALIEGEGEVEPYEKSRKS